MNSKGSPEKVYVGPRQHQRNERPVKQTDPGLEPETEHLKTND